YAVIDAARAYGARESHERGVADRASGVIVIEALAAGADHVDDHAFAALAHQIEIGAGEMDIAEDLQLPAGAPGGIVDIIDRAARNHAGVVVEDVDIGIGGDQFFARFRLRQVERPVPHIDAVRRAQFGRVGFELRFVARGQAEIAAFGSEAARRSEAEALRAAGDQYILPFKIELERHPRLP